jgi:hypothetical protein
LDGRYSYLVARSTFTRGSRRGILVLSSAAPVVSVAAAFVEQFIEEASRRTSKEQWFAIELGKRASQINMAHELLLHDADEVYKAGTEKRDLSLKTQARHRADAAVIADTALTSANGLLRALGGAALRASHPLERPFRDIYTMATHHRVLLELACELFGRVLLEREA